MILDLILVALIALRAFLGYRRGMLSALVSLGGRIAAVFLSLFLASPISRLVAGLIKTPIDDAPFLSTFAAGAKETLFYGIVFCALVVLFLIAARILTGVAKKFNKIPVLGNANRILGLILGAVEGLVFAWIVSAVVALLPDGTVVHAADTLLVPVFASVNPFTLIASFLLSA